MSTKKPNKIKRAMLIIHAGTIIEIGLVIAQGTSATAAAFLPVGGTHLAQLGMVSGFTTIGLLVELSRGNSH